MPWKFIVFILLCVVFSIFIGVNLNNSADIDFLFVRAEKAPVFLVVLFSFLAGACIGLMASVFTKTKKRKKDKLKDGKGSGKEVLPEDQAVEQAPVVTAGKRRGRKRK